MVTVLGELGGIQGTGQSRVLQSEEVKGVRDSSSRTPLCCTSQIMSDHVTGAAAGLLGWEAMLVVIMCRYVLGYHLSSQADGTGIEVRALKHHTSYGLSLWGRKDKILIYSLDSLSLDPDL